MTRAQPNILFVMTDQQRFDTIAALGNEHIHTPNLDRLVRRGLSFTNAYSTCPVCVAARYTIRTGCEPPTTRIFTNCDSGPAPGQAPTLQARCGPYLAETMRERGYRTFGIGKFHSHPRDENLGYDVHLHSEELYGSMENRLKDDYARWIRENVPAYDVEHLMGERTEMYYIPQRSAQPAEFTVERWAADRAVELLSVTDEPASPRLRSPRRPYFGFLSFVGPHPPFAPPFPFNHLYDPDRMPIPVRGDIETDHMDDFIPSHARRIWADGINDHLARILKARYYGEITYIDDCLGSVLDAVEARDDADNTLICFFADHGDHMGDHTAWQKESFFDAACRIPFLLSWPARLPADVRRDEVVCLTDLFGVATHAAGATQAREGIDLLGVVAGTAEPRPYVVGYHGVPGTRSFKAMVRDLSWKYIYMANGGREQLFHVETDPHELTNLAATESEVRRQMRDRLVKACDQPGARDAIESGDLITFGFESLAPSQRIRQFDTSMGPDDFPEDPGELIRRWKAGEFGC